MWENLLSGTIGSVIGLVGAVAVALLTVRWTRTQQTAHAEQQRQIDKSGGLAYHLVALYEELKAIEIRAAEPTDADLTRLAPLARDFRRSVVVDAPLLPPAIEKKMKESRQRIAAFLTPRDAPLTRDEVKRVRLSVKDAGDELQKFRRPSVPRSPNAS